MQNESVIEIKNLGELKQIITRQSQLPQPHWYCFKKKSKVTKQCESCVHLEVNQTCRNLTG
jgi:hypothetical protein